MQEILMDCSQEKIEGQKKARLAEENKFFIYIFKA